MEDDLLVGAAELLQPTLTSVEQRIDQVSVEPRGDDGDRRVGPQSRNVDRRRDVLAHDLPLTEKSMRRLRQMLMSELTRVIHPQHLPKRLDAGEAVRLRLGKAEKGSM